MKKNIRILLLSLLLLGGVFSFPALAQTEKPFQISMILWRGVTDAEKGFMDYFETRHIPVKFTILDSNKDKTKIPGFIEQAKTEKPDLIYTFGTTITIAVAGVMGNVNPAKNITEIPVVFNIVADPIGAKLVGNFESSQRNLTGTSHLIPLSTQLNTINLIFPLKRLGVIYNPLEKNSILAVEDLERLSREQNFELIKAAIPEDPPDKPITYRLSETASWLIKQNPQIVYFPSDSFVIFYSHLLVAQIHGAGIPTYSATEEPIRRGGAMLGMVSRYKNVGRFAAYKAEQILRKHKRPDQIPIETLKRFSLLINMSAAKDLKIYPPITVMKFAEIVSSF